jgi:hypothetical protein
MLDAHPELAIPGETHFLEGLPGSNTDKLAETAFFAAGAKRRLGRIS